MNSIRRGRKLPVACGLGACILFGVLAVSWKGILIHYHLCRLRSEPEYLYAIVDRPPGTPERKAVRAFLRSLPREPKLRAPDEEKAADGVQILDGDEGLARIRLRLSDAAMEDGQLEGREQPIELPILAARPIHDWGSGDYAVVLASHPECGTLYELGIASRPQGSGNCVTESRDYVLRDRERRWKYLGRGPSEGRGKSGGSESHLSSVRSEVTWTADPAAPVRIRFVVEYWSVEVGEDTSHFKPNLVTLSDAILEGPPPAHLRYVSGTYMLTQSSDTLETLAERLAAWESDCWDPQREACRKARREILAGILACNPDVPDQDILEGTRVWLPDP